MEQIVLKADINECTLVGWRLNTGEVNARVLNVEMCEYLSSCERQFVTFELADGTVYETLVVGGMAKIPYIEKPQFVKIGLYAENINGDECEKRYSTRPANVYVNMGSYTDDSIDPPIPTPGDYSVLLEKFEENKEKVNTALAALGKGTIITMDKVNVWELEAGAYYVNSIVFYATPHPPVYPNCVEMQSEKGLLYVHIDISNNTTRNFYLFANGNIYFGTSTPNALDVADGIGSISSIVADIRHEITNDNTDGFATKRAVYNFGENIKTELLANIGDKADRTELESALSGKVNKSDILTEVDVSEIYNDNQFYNANAVNLVLNVLNEEFVTNDKFDRIVAEVSNTFQTKVNKSDILPNLDLDASPNEIYNAPALNAVLLTLQDAVRSLDERLTVIDGGIDEISALVGGA